MRRWLSFLKLVMAGAWSLLIHTGCEHEGDQAGYWETEREGIELAQQLKLAEYRLSLAGEDQVEELSKLGETLRTLEQRRESLERLQISLSMEIQQLESLKATAFNRALEHQRASAQGRKFTTLSLADGRTFQNVTVTGIHDSGVSIRHEHGTARVGYVDLKPEQQAFFGLEETSSLAAQAQEEQEALAYDQWIEQTMLAQAETAERSVVGAFSGERQAMETRPRVLAQSSSADRLRPLAQPATRFGSGTWTGRWRYGSSYRSYRPRYYYVYRQPAAPLPYSSPCAPRMSGSRQSFIANPDRLPRHQPIPDSIPSQTP